MPHRARRLAAGLTLAGLALALLAAVGLPLARAQSIRLYLPLGAKRLAQATVAPPASPTPTHGPYPTHAPTEPLPVTATVTPHPTYPPHATPTAGSPAPTQPPHATQPPCPTHEPVTPCPTQLPHPAVPPIVVVPVGIELDAWFHDDVVIQAVTVTGDTLALTAMYSGGCRDHDLWLVASAMFLMSMPPQVDLLVSHNAHGDACEAAIRRDLSFDLAPLRRTATGGVAGHGTLLLRLRGWPEHVRYDY